jgi:lysophospholipase L1-like esterase
MIEIASFAAIMVSNVMLYGRSHEGSAAYYDPWTLFRDVRGPRNTAYNLASEDERFNRLIWAFGGSTMRGATIHDERTIPSVLAQALNDDEGRLRVTVRNFGEDSYTSLIELHALQRSLIREPERPDLIIFYDGFNDASYLLQYRSPEGHHARRRIQAAIEGYHENPLGLLRPIRAAYYVSYTRELFAKLRQMTMPISIDNALIEEFARALELRYDYVARQACAFDAAFLLVWQPYYWTETDPIIENVKAEEERELLPARRIGVFVQTVSVATEAVARRLKDKPYFADMRNALCGRTTPAYQPDGVHLNDAGRRIMGLAIARAIKERNLLSDPESRAIVVGRSQAS